MTTNAPLELDAVIFGGGGAGLWLLDELRRRNVSVLLLEAHELGHGQTIASQGIIHGGLKYTLSGLLSGSARSIREMPLRWRRSLAGELPPDLSRTRLRAEFCYLWDTGTIVSRLAMLGARTGLRVKPIALEKADRPTALAACPGTVARLDEQVIDPPSFIADLAGQNRDLLLRIDAEHGLEFTRAESGGVKLVRLLNPETGEPFDLAPRRVILTAGGGNATLRGQIGLEGESLSMQRRPLHMVMARGSLSMLNGHCVDGKAPRLTITSAVDIVGRTVWQLGGEIAEQGVDRSPQEQIVRARQELDALLPPVNRTGVEWATYRIDRAEGSSSGRRPDDVSVRVDHNVITAWPTKLALVPKLAERIVELSDESGAFTAETLRHGEEKENHSGAAAQSQQSVSLRGESHAKELVRRWPRPGIALPPWEKEERWLLED